MKKSVSDAFADDPAWAYLVGDDYARLAPLFAAALFDTRVGRGEVWVTDAVEAVAMWESPSSDPDALEHARGIWREYTTQVGSAAARRLDAYNRAVKDAAADGDYWYLGVLATSPESQGRGLATAVIQPVLQLADEARLDCCLETSTAGNREFYRRRGFTEATPVEIPDGPPTWWLTRRPRQGCGR